MKNKNIELFKKLLFSYLPFWLRVFLLFIFILNDIIFLWDIRLTEQWLYIILWLFAISIFPNIIKDVVADKVKNIMENNEEVNKIFENVIKNNSEFKTVKNDINNLENNNDLSSVTLWKPQEKINNIIDNEKVQDFIYKNILWYINKSNSLEIQLRPNWKDFVIRNTKRQFIHFSYKNTKKSLVILFRYWFEEANIDLFNKDLKNNELSYFIDYLSSYNYNLTKEKYEENPNFIWVKLEINFNDKKENNKKEDDIINYIDIDKNELKKLFKKVININNIS